MKTLISAFEGCGNSSNAILSEINAGCDKIIFKNDKLLSQEQLYSALDNSVFDIKTRRQFSVKTVFTENCYVAEKTKQSVKLGCDYDYIIMLGQKPVIREKITLETTASGADGMLQTAFDCCGIAEFFRENGCAAKISHNAGTSFCNHIYYACLKYISDRGLDTRAVFVHVPYLKNMSDPGRFADIFDKYISGL